MLYTSRMWCVHGTAENEHQYYENNEKTIISALAAVALVASAQAVNELNIVQAGNCYAGDYSFSFTLSTEQLSAITDGQVLAGYWGNLNNGYAATPSSHYTNAVTMVVTDGAVTLKIGRGELSDVGYSNASTFTLSSDTTMNFRNSVSFTTTLQADVVYTLSVTGGNQAMTPTLSWAGGSETLDSYAGNMNGGVGDGNLFNSDFNESVATRVVSVPEPATAALSLLALAGLAARRRR